MKFEQQRWHSFRRTGEALVPMVTSGFDPRPFVNQGTFYNADAGHWMETASPRQIGEQLQAAMDFNRRYPESTPANTILIYAWNENAEGGWIVPTLFELRDSGHPLCLDAIRSILKPYSVPGKGWEVSE